MKICRIPLTKIRRRSGKCADFQWFAEWTIDEEEALDLPTIPFVDVARVLRDEDHRVRVRVRRQGEEHNLQSGEFSLGVSGNSSPGFILSKLGRNFGSLQISASKKRK